jgi:serine/threonine protein kinase
MNDVILFTYASPKYFEPLGEAANAGIYVDVLKRLLPADWTTSRFDIWIEARPPDAAIPDQGFKLHISASLRDAEDVLRVAVPLLVGTRTSFKVLADPFFHRMSNSKRFPRGFSGKFITIYPTDQESFRELARDLARATQHLHGPYVLSDRRLGENGIVYYRYGAFKKTSDLQADGTRRFLIKGCDGTLVPDERTPFFKLPKGIRDPFSETRNAEEGNRLLNARYRVEEALNFTNTGGVYRAFDLLTGSPVVIKEARPHTLMIAGPDLSRDAVDALQHECDCLKVLQSLPCVPRFIDSFIEWEHHFLVESYVDGTSLAYLRAQDSFIIMERMFSPQELVESCVTWRDIGVRLLSAVESVHSCGVFLGDISPVNVLRNDSNGELTFIDLESASRMDDSGEAALFNTRWSYPGFRSRHPRSRRGIGKLDDYYACGMLLYDLICPIQALFDLDKGFQTDKFLNHFVQAGLPTEMSDIIRKLWSGEVEGAASTLHSFCPSDVIIRESKRSVRLTFADKSDITGVTQPFENTVSDTLNGLVQSILASGDTSREDRLWPSDAVVFRTNPLNLASGACGIAIFLSDILGRLPADVSEWILARKIDVTDYPPGLYSGLAGIAWAFSELGWHTRAASIMRSVPQSPLAFSSSTLFDGVAGWGLAALALFAATHDDEFLKIAGVAGKHLVKTGRIAPEGLHWMSETDDSVKLGMGFGSSGIGLFLLYLWAHTQDGTFLEAARSAIDFEVGHAKERERDGALVWPYAVGGKVYSPYWLRGGGGVASTLIRFYQILREDRYLDMARRAATPCAGFFSIAPHSFEGLASMGETLLDMYQVTCEQAYYDYAVLKAHQILLYKIEQDEGIAFPGRFLVRISHDYGTGGAGIGVFLQRVLTKGPRKFHDLRGFEDFSAVHLKQPGPLEVSKTSR